MSIPFTLLLWCCCSAFQASGAFRLQTIQHRNVFQNQKILPFAISPSRRSSSRLASAVNNVDWGRKTVLQLQKELRSRGLSDKGSKTVLIERLESLNTVKDHSRDDDAQKRLNASKSFNGAASETISQSASPFSSYSGQGASTTSSYAGSETSASSSYAWSGASLYAGSGTSATSSYRESYSASNPATSARSSFAQNQTLVDMESEEARRIENYLRKHKKEQMLNQQKQQQQRPLQRKPQQRPPIPRQRQPQQQTQSAQSSFAGGHQRAADPFMNGGSPVQPPAQPPAQSAPQAPPRKETIIDVTSKATYTERTVHSPSREPRKSDDEKFEGGIASAQQATWGRNSFKPSPSSKTSPPPKSEKSTLSATSRTMPYGNNGETGENGTQEAYPKAKKTPSPWMGKKTESRQFLSIDKDDFLKPYDATVEIGGAGDDRAAEAYDAAIEFGGAGGVKVAEGSEVEVSADDVTYTKSDTTIEPELFPDLKKNGDKDEEGSVAPTGKTLPDADVIGAEKVLHDDLKVIATANVEGNAPAEKKKDSDKINSDSKESVNGRTSADPEILTGKDPDVPEEVFFFDTRSEDTKTNGAAIEDGLWTREEPYPFVVLGVEPGATMAEIKAAYRKKAMEFHVDNNLDDNSEKVAENLRRLVEAFQVLSGGYKKGKYEKEYRMLQRLQRRQEQEQEQPVNPDEDGGTATSDFSLMEDVLPPFLYDQVNLRFNSTDPLLRPLQQQCYKAIVAGDNIVLNAPEDSGKTLGYLLPLLANLPDIRNVSHAAVPPTNDNTSKNKRGRRRKRNRRNKLAAEVQELSQPCKPTLLFVAPSKDSALHIGKLCSQYHHGKGDFVATVFEGVPVKKQKILLHKSSLEIVVGTPARLLKYIQMRVLDPSGLKTVALDEADGMIGSLPIIESIFESIPSNDYQKILASAEMPSDLLEFCEENIGLTQESSRFVTLSSTKDGLEAEIKKENELENCDIEEAPVEDRSNETESKVLDVPVDAEEIAADYVPMELNPQLLASMDHWHTATRPSDRPILSLDIIATLVPSPKIVTLFVASDDEVESVSRELEMFHGKFVKALRETASAESRQATINSIRDHVDSTATENMILVTSDAATLGVNLPHADLVLQHGIPRQLSNKNLYDVNVYMARIQSVCENGQKTNTMLLYDYEDEGRLLPGLQTEMEVDHDIVLKPRALPAPQHTLKASYVRTKSYCNSLPCIPMVVGSFEQELKEEIADMDDMDREDELVHRLAVAMSALWNHSNLNGENC